MMNQPELTLEEKDFLNSYIDQRFGSSSWDNWDKRLKLYYHVMIDAHIWKALGEKVDDKFIKELDNESLSSRWECKRQVIRY